VGGDWDEALRTAEQGTLLAGRTGMRLIEPLLAWTRAQVHALRGDWALADRAVRDADAGPRDYEIMRVAGALARASVAEARADYAGVLRALDPLRQPWAGGSIDEPGAWPWPDVYANALAIEGRYDEAEVFLRPHEALAAERGHRSARARLGYARGRLLGGTGDLPAARVAFEEAAALLEDLPLPYDRARTHFAWGQTLRRAGKRREADPVLQTARDLYDRLGATTYVERCDRELRAGGVHAGRPAPAERDAVELTPQEELVAELVARGMSNREVGTELFVSTKTVQYHLTRIYAKLGVRSRGELAAQRAVPPEG
jgi:ATP/maltotriose-dependent transcriptional regulator MalT